MITTQYFSIGNEGASATWILLTPICCIIFFWAGYLIGQYRAKKK